MRPLVLAVCLATLPVALASHQPDSDPCGAGGHVALGVVQVGSGRAGDPAPTYYVDDRNTLSGNGVWIYEESNGRDGLQRGGSPWWGPGHDASCWDDPNEPPDRLVF